MNSLGVRPTLIGRRVIRGLCLFALSCLLVGEGHAQLADLNGTWSNGIAPIQIDQEGSHVHFRYVTDDFDHSFDGRFVSPNTVEGAYAPRHNRANGCDTKLAVSLDVTSSDSFVLRWRALDSNCDLRAGQTGEDAPFARQ